MASGSFYLTYYSGLGIYCTALFKNPPDTSVCDPNQDEGFFGERNVKIADYAYQLIKGSGTPFTFGHVAGGSRSKVPKRSVDGQELDE
jgi:hypothetical protein